MQEPDEMPAINAVKWDTFSKIVNMMPVVGKWMTNLVATTPITAKAMKNLYSELNKQKDLKRTYHKKYKDLQAVVTTAEQSVTVQQPTAVIGTKVKAAPKSLKQSL